MNLLLPILIPHPTPMKHFNDKVKAKIVELVPELQTCQCVEYVQEHAFNGETIRLADVLRAIGNGSGYHLAIDGTFCHRDGSTEIQWNLTTEFDNQTDEVKAFIGSLLGVTE